jgi:hypothetical protein
MCTLTFAAEYYPWNQLCVLSVSAFPFLLLPTSSNSHIPFHVQVSGMICACLPCHNRTKIQIRQKHQTQKNEGTIFLRSIFLPLEWDLFAPLQSIP